MTPPPKQASPVKTRTPSPTNDAGAAGLTSEDQETQTISSEIEPDESISDEGYAESTSTSYVSSIASDVRRGIEENGRLYAAYGKHKPWVPVDDAEMDRNDFQHCKFTLLLNNELHLAPIKQGPHKILDLGTGSGIWAIDMGDKHPSAEIIGVDTAAVQPNILPPNVQFEIDDIESDWLYRESSFDFIHGRELVLSIRNWPRLVQQSFRALKPGGYFELSGSLPVISSDDGTHIPNSAFEEMAQVYFDMGDRIGASGKAPLSWKTQLEEAGFENVVEKVLKIPTNPWPKDPRMKKIGAFELSHFRDGISNIFARGYTQILGGDPLYFEILMARAKAEVSNRRMHTYLLFYVVYGQRPLEAQV